MFETGNKLRATGISGIKKGQKQRKTILKEAIGINSFEDLKPLALKNFNELMNDRNKHIKALMTKEAVKYIFPHKKEIDLKGTGTINLHIIKEIAGNIS